MADKGGFDDDFDEDDGDEPEDPEDDAPAGRKNGAKDKAEPTAEAKRHKKLAKAALGKKARDKKISLAFEPAEMDEERQTN